MFLFRRTLKIRTKFAILILLKVKNMGFISDIFGSTADKYSKTEHSLTTDQIKALVSKVKVRSLTTTEEKLVESVLCQRRRGDGKISLQQVYESLTKLKNQHKISVADRDGLMKVFEEYFDKHFK